MPRSATRSAEATLSPEKSRFSSPKEVGWIAKFDQAAIGAQAQLDAIQGVERLWFCGAWTGYGFHEDGLNSALAVASRLGCRAPWQAAIEGLESAA